MEVREYDGEEEKVIVAWNRSFPEDPVGPIMFRQKIIFNPKFERELCLLAEEEGKVIGFAFGQQAGESGTIDVIFVVPEKRRQGIGSELLQELFKRLKEKGVRSVRVGGGMRYFFPGFDLRNEAALSFFRSLGFEEVDRLSVSMGMSLMNYSRPDDVKLRAAELQSEGIEVRPLVPALIPRLFDFLDTEFPEWREDARWTMERFPDDPSIFTVAVKGEDVLGYAQFASDGNYERFGPFGVASQFRNKGIGAVIFSETLIEMKAHGARNAWFMWGGGRNESFYLRYGMKELRRYANMRKGL